MAVEPSPSVSCATRLRARVAAPMPRAAKKSSTAGDSSASKLGLGRRGDSSLRLRMAVTAKPAVRAAGEEESTAGCTSTLGQRCTDLQGSA